MEKELLIQKIKQAYKDYCEREFGDVDDDDILEKESVLDLMYTTVNNEEWEVQVNYDLNSECLITSLVNGQTKYVFEETHLLKDMLQDLENGGWDGWYSYAHEICDEKFNLDLEW